MPRGKKKIYTEEEARERQRNRWRDVQKPKEKEDYERLAPIRVESHGNWKIPRDILIDFQKEIRERNVKRFDEILRDEAIWARINESSDEWTIKRDRQERKKNKGVYVSDKEMQRANDIIYGGMSGRIIEDDEEPSEYTNPYEE